MLVNMLKLYLHFSKKCVQKKGFHTIINEFNYFIGLLKYLCNPYVVLQHKTQHVKRVTLVETLRRTNSATPDQHNAVIPEKVYVFFIIFLI